MADNKHTNDPLEQFFRDKSKEFEIDFNEKDWQDMEQRLDQRDKVLLSTNQKRKRFIAAAILLIIIGGLSFIIYQNYGRINELEAQLKKQPTNQTIDDKFTQQRTNEDDGRTSNSSNKNKQPIKQGSEKSSTQSRRNQSITGNKKSSDSDQYYSKKGDKNNLIHRSTRSTPLLAYSIQPPQNIYDALEFQPGQQVLLVTQPEQNRNKTQPSTLLAGLANEKNSPLSSNRDPDNRTYSGFSVGIIAGPDFSTVGALENFYKPGFKIGATVAYNWNRNWGLSGGLVYASVNYTAGGNEYSPPNDYWTYGVVPKKSTAACAILSIPIRLTFNFMQLQDSRFYATAGITSYIMLEETYQFDYARDNASHLIQKWNVQTGNQYWLSNATFSIGYEWDVNNTISLRIEPYINIPIRKVGWGNVALYSTGTLISVQYHLP